MSIQVLPNERLETLQNRLYKKRIVLKPRRGAITDRNGIEFAASIPSHSLYADPSLIKHPKRMSKKLAKVLRIPKERIYKKIKNKKRRFVWLQRHIDPAGKKKVQKWKHRGLAFVEEPKRIYPNGKLLSQVLGIVGREGNGLEGVELVKEEVLSGVPKSIAMNKDARGRPLLLNGRIFTDSPDGTDIQLTVDAQLQFVLEKELKVAMRKHEALSAVGVILEAESGEVLAMANVAEKSLASSRQYLRRNRAVTDAFEPGSTFKPLVVAAALEEGLAKPNTKFFCEDGRYKIGNRYITESDSNHNFGWLSMSDVLAFSSNIGTTKIAQKVGAKKLYKYISDFGFGAKTKIAFPAESRGILHKTPWNPHLLSNISFGHGITTTPLQIAAAYGAFANGGVWKQPVLFKGEKQKQKRVLSKENARLMRLMLMASTSQKSTGANARVPGYLVAGKTGTAQKVNPKGGGYMKGAYISSFAGFVPANDPKYVIYVAVDEPKKGYYGSQVAAPIFSKVAQKALRQSGLQPLLISQSDIISEPERKPASEEAVTKSQSTLHTVVPELSGLSLREALERVEGTDIKIDIRGSGYVKTTLPKPGKPLKAKSRLRLILE